MWGSEGIMGIAPGPYGASYQMKVTDCVLTTCCVTPVTTNEFITKFQGTFNH